MLSFAGVYLLTIGGRTPYFVVAGFGIAVSGVLIAAGKRMGLYIYCANYVLMLVWSSLEADEKTNHVVPRMFLPTIIGLYLLSHKVRSRLN